MAQEEQHHDFFKILLTAVKDFLQPGILVFSDSAARAELFGTLGLDPNANAVGLPNTTNLDAYIASESQEVDTFKLISAFADLTQLMLAIEGVIRGAVAAGDNPDFAADEIFGAFLNSLLLDFIRRKSPEVYSMVNLFQVVTEQTAAEGGMNNFFDDVIVAFFKRLGSGLDTEESTEAVSTAIFIGFVGLLYLVDKLVLKKNNIDALKIEADYGYEGALTSATPIADRISNRFISYSLTLNPVDDPDNQITLYNSFGFVPKEHGGIASCPGPLRGSRCGHSHY